MSTVEVSAVTKRFGATTALAGVDLTLPSGHLMAVLGPSGCGKTTLLKILAGFLKPTGGVASANGAPITKPSWERGVVFQHANLYPWLTVRKNVELGLKFRGIDAAKRREAAEEALTLVGLEGFEDKKTYELSGGMQQRTQIARVLANDPEIILMDEPFGALDALTRERLQMDLLKIARERKKTIFFITHSVEEAVFLGDRVLVMSPRPGRVVLDEPVRISAEYGRVLPGKELRSTTEFVALRDKIADTIYAGERH